LVFEAPFERGVGLGYLIGTRPCGGRHEFEPSPPWPSDAAPYPDADRGTIDIGEYIASSCGSSAQGLSASWHIEVPERWRGRRVQLTATIDVREVLAGRRRGLGSRSASASFRMAGHTWDLVDIACHDRTCSRGGYLLGKAGRTVSLSTNVVLGTEVSIDIESHASMDGWGEVFAGVRAFLRAVTVERSRGAPGSS
jgi:hypothetical protein